MNELSYLQWLVKHTPTTWWHDSGDPDEFAFGLKHGATGVTTNPVLTSQALFAQPAYWHSHLEPYHEQENAEGKVAALMQSVARPLASQLLPVHTASQGGQGYVCAQVNPADAANREVMLATARTCHCSRSGCPRRMYRRGNHDNRYGKFYCSAGCGNRRTTSSRY